MENIHTPQPPASTSQYHYSSRPSFSHLTSTAPTGAATQKLLDGSDFFAMRTTPDPISQQQHQGQPSMHTNDLFGAQHHAFPDFDESMVGAPGNFGGYQAGMNAKGNSTIPPHLQSSAYQYQSPNSLSSLPDGQSPMTSHGHRLSIGSNNGLFGQQIATGSVDGSDPDPPSPTSARKRGSMSGDKIGSNPPASESNRTVNSQDQDEDKSKDPKQDVPPPWSELKTKAGKERKRLPLACIACRRKKIRCSGEKPACKHCLRSRIPCVYKVTTRKAAPRTDYMAMLDKRLKRMEDRVIKCIPKEEHAHINAVARAVVKPAIPGLPPKQDKKRAAEQAFGEELDEWSKQRTTGLPTGKDPKAAGATDQKIPDSDENKLLMEGQESLPSKELQEHLAEVYFDFVYGQNYHLLHKPSFMRKLAAGQIPPVLTLAVCAIAARFSSHPEVRTEPAFLRGSQWATAAKDIALKRFDIPNITILIVYLLLGLHEFGTCQGGRSWMFGGMAQRMAYALQLHKDLDHDPKGNSPNDSTELTFTDREIRRRTMWACFMMDRFNSSGTDRPLFVNEQYIKAQLPIKEHYFQMEINGPTEDLEGGIPNPVQPRSGQLSDATENMGVAAYLIRLTCIWGQLIRYNNLGGKEKDEHPMWSEQSAYHGIKKLVDKWKGALPESLHYTQENLDNHATEKISNQFMMLHIFYNQILLFMNRFALPQPGARPPFPKDMPPQFFAEAARTALEAANQISALVNEAMDHRLVAPFAGYCAFYSSTVHINGVFSKNPALEASSKQNLAWNVKYLSKMKKHWGMFHFVAENLKELYRRHADAARSGPPPSHTPSGPKPSEIFQYGDWFDRYPHGVSGTDYEDPAVEVKKEPGSDAVLGQKSDLQSVEEFFSKLAPPSRTTQRKQQKKKRTKSESQPTGAASEASNSANNPPLQPQTQQQNLQANLAQQNPALMAALMNQNANFNNPSMNFANTQQQQQFSSGGQDFNQDIALLRAQQQQGGNQQHHNPGTMSQLDRHMVLSSYAGLDPVHSNLPASMDTGNNPLDANAPFDIDLSSFNHGGHGAFADHTTSGANGSEGDSMNFGGMGWDQSSAWFMPFNLDPPPMMGDDSSFFNTSGYDLGGLGMQGFGDLGGMGGLGGMERNLAPEDEGGSGDGDMMG